MCQALCYIMASLNAHDSEVAVFISPILEVCTPQHRGKAGGPKVTQRVSKARKLPTVGPRAFTKKEL